jgi:hypothetical protein
LFAVIGVLLLFAALVNANASRVTWIVFKRRSTRLLTVLLALFVLWAIGSRQR